MFWYYLFSGSFIYRLVFIWVGGELESSVREKYLYLKEDRRSDDLFNPGNNLAS